MVVAGEENIRHAVEIRSSRPRHLDDRQDREGKASGFLPRTPRFPHRVVLSIETSIAPPAAYTHAEREDRRVKKETNKPSLRAFHVREPHIHGYTIHQEETQVRPYTRIRDLYNKQDT